MKHARILLVDREEQYADLLATVLKTLWLNTYHSDND